MGNSKRIYKPPDTYTGDQTEWDALSRDKQYHIVNKVKIAAMRKISYANNREVEREQGRLYRTENRDKINFKKRVWAKKNTKKIREANKKRGNRPGSKAKIKVTQAKYYIKNKEKGRLYRTENRDKINLQRRVNAKKNTREANEKMRNRPGYKEKLKVTRAKDYIKNKEKVNAKALAYRNANREKIASYRNMNRQKINAIGRVANARVRAAYTKVNRLLLYAKNNAKNRARTVKKREALYERIAVAVAASNKEIAERA